MFSLVELKKKKLPLLNMWDVDGKIDVKKRDGIKRDNEMDVETVNIRVTIQMIL